MPTYVSLLRGINVGGNKLIKMADLRALYELLGLTNVQTLLQSGNAVFGSAQSDSANLSQRIETAIETRFGFHVDLYLLTAGAFRAAYTANPFAAESDRDPAKLLAFFLKEPPSDAMLGRLDAANTGPEIIRAVGRVLYIYFPDGLGKSKLGATPAFTKIPGTGRNWNTVTKLHTMLAAAAPDSP